MQALAPLLLYTRSLCVVRACPLFASQWTPFHSARPIPPTIFRTRPLVPPKWNPPGAPGFRLFQSWLTSLTCGGHSLLALPFDESHTPMIHMPMPRQTPPVIAVEGCGAQGMVSFGALVRKLVGCWGHEAGRWRPLAPDCPPPFAMCLISWSTDFSVYRLPGRFCRANLLRRFSLRPVFPACARISLYGCL